MNKPLSELIKAHFKAVEAKNLDAVMAFYDADAEFLDPHYPNVHMKGTAEILEGLTWGFNGVKTFSFTLMNYFENEARTSASIEMATKLELSNGQKLSYPQVFIIETKQGKISRLQAYETYGPHGMHNIMLKATRLIKQFRKK